MFPNSDPRRPTPTLLACVYLLGIHLSSDPRLRTPDSEKIFLSRALVQTASPNGSDLIHALQVQILLAYYFFSSGRFLEGKYHAARACATGISGGMHRIRQLSRSSRDAGYVEQAERIDAWWGLVILDECWAVAFTSPPNITRDLLMQVETPWPLERGDHREPRAPSISTLQAFWSLGPEDEASRRSSKALHVKASLLWHRATEVAASWSSGTHLFPVPLVSTI